MTDFTFVVKRKTTVDEVNNFRQAILTDKLSGILAVTDEPIVSSDIIGRRESAIVDLASPR